MTLVQDSEFARIGVISECLLENELAFIEPSHANVIERILATAGCGDPRQSERHRPLWPRRVPVLPAANRMN